MRNGDSGINHGTVFFMRYYGPASGSIARNGTFRCSDDFVSYWYSRNQDCMDFWDFSTSQIFVCAVHFLSGVMDIDYCDAGDLFLFCQKKSTQKYIEHSYQSFCEK